MKSSKYYTQEGSQYISVREARLSDSVQKRRAKKFEAHVSATDQVLDFGCGSGGILSCLDVAARIGVEVLPEFQAMARGNGLEVYGNISQVPQSSVDVVISHHAMEHVPNPFENFQGMFRALKSGGRLIIYVPAESPHQLRFDHWEAKEPNQHLYSWTPLTLGNLATLAGFIVTNARTVPIVGSARLDRTITNSIVHDKIGRLLAWHRNRYEVFVEARKDDC